ncbi:O-antigen ligase family protein [Alphaproteobacteria bacterium]|nr:O-antigen ligase family protein [Alphaproteobacteria bacterium]
MHVSNKFAERTISAHLKKVWRDMADALSEMPRWEKSIHIFWLMGPFILLIERTPSDIWLSLIGIAFILRAIINRDGSWLGFFWVRTCFLFLFVCLVSSAFSELPVYAFSEALAWFRFPVFAMATAFWLGSDKRLLYGMLFSTFAGIMIMTGILSAEMILEGQKGGRLTWPYDDLMPGNYLAKVGLPVFGVTVALAIGAKPRLAILMGSLSFVSIMMSLLTGERINFLIRACGGMLSALVWKPNFKRYVFLIFIEVAAIFVVFMLMPSVQSRFTSQVVASLPTNPQSDYYRLMGAGLDVFESAPIIGIGAATHRELCPSIIGESKKFRCDNHPHNFYVQLLAETGVIGLITGCLMIVSITWAAFFGWRRNRDNVVAATAFVIPLGLFFPIQSTGDFFGQWNNIFLWSAVALALAAARTLTFEKRK